MVLTVRDLARQIPSAWQEDLKAGSATAYGAYLRRLRSVERSGKASSPGSTSTRRSWPKRWAKALSPDRIHIVTVPPSGSPTTLLLERFARVLGVDPARLEPEDRPSNSSLGQVQAEVLRRVNAQLPDEVHRRYVYSDVVKRSFGARVLGPRRRVEKSWSRTASASGARASPTATSPSLPAPATRSRGGWRTSAPVDAAFATRSSASRPSGSVAASSVAALSTMLAADGAAEAQRRTGEIPSGGADGPRSGPSTVRS